MRALFTPILAFIVAGGGIVPPLIQAAPVAAAARPAPAPTTVPVVAPTIVARFPHDPAAFTEGLIWHDGMLVESVGLEGRSDVRRVDLASGKIVARAGIPPEQFGEGLAAWKGDLVSLTWHDGIAHRWNARSLKSVGTARYRGEGWGLASTPANLVRSDGSATLTFHDPVTMAEQRRIQVTLNGRPITQINELEWIDGALFANVWHQPFLLKIDPANGVVKAVIDLRAIVAEVNASDPEAVANGIAWDAKTRRMFITGKLWPTLFEVRIPAQ